MAPTKANLRHSLSLQLSGLSRSKCWKDSESQSVTDWAATSQNPLIVWTCAFRGEARSISSFNPPLGPETLLREKLLQGFKHFSFRNQQRRNKIGIGLAVARIHAAPARSGLPAEVFPSFRAAIHIAADSRMARWSFTGIAVVVGSLVSPAGWSRYPSREVC